MAITKKMKKYIENKAIGTRAAYVASRRFPSRRGSTNKRVKAIGVYSVNLSTALNRPMPSAVKMKFYFNQQYQTALNGISTIMKNWRLNSIYDPEYSVAIGQVSATPLVAMATFYKEYRVVGAKVQITVGLREDQTVASHFVIKAANDAYSETNTANTPLTIVANGPHYQYGLVTKSNQMFYNRYIDIALLTGMS